MRIRNRNKQKKTKKREKKTHLTSPGPNHLPSRPTYSSSLSPTHLLTRASTLYALPFSFSFVALTCGSALSAIFLLPMAHRSPLAVRRRAISAARLGHPQPELSGSESAVRYKCRAVALPAAHHVPFRIRRERTEKARSVAAAVNLRWQHRSADDLASASCPVRSPA